MAVVRLIQEFDDVDLEQFAADGLTLPLLRLNDIDLPGTVIRVGGRDYQYDRSYPFKGYGAVLPGYLAEQIAVGRRPLIVERVDRYYVYFELPAA
jgi:hypothetical protein